MPSKNARGDAVGGQLLHIKECQAMCIKDLFGCEKGEIGKVFMVNGVKLIFFHQPLKMWEFHGDYPMRFQQDLHSRNKIVQIGNLREYVVAKEQIRLLARCREFPSRFSSKELHQRRDALLEGLGG